MDLNEKHLAELRASGLTDETIAAAGIRSINGEARDVLGWQPRHHHWGDAILFPYALPSGEEFCRLKPDFPRRDVNGRPIKYESPKGRGNHAYYPPRFWEAWPTATTVILVEGEKKCLAVAQAGFCCIGLGGVWSWQQRRLRTDTGRAYGKRELIPDLSRLDWKGRRVVVLFDSDAVSNPNVRLAEARLAETLSFAGAEVRVARLPQEGADKVGADDFLVAHGENGPEELRKVIAAAEPAVMPEPPQVLDLARMFIDAEFTAAEGPTLRWFQDEFYSWNGKRYRKVPRSDLRGVALQWLDSIGHSRVTPKLAGDVLDCVASEVRVPFDVEPPALLTEHGAERRDWLAMDNGLLDIRTAIEGQDKPIRPHTVRWFCTRAVPYRYIPEAECPAWLAFLDDIFDGDEERIDLLGEWLGYCCSDDTTHQAIMMLEGPRRSGKGTTMRALRRLVGKENCVSPALSGLSETFALWSLLDRKVAICPDAHLGHGQQAIAVLERLKEISGEDAVEVHRKNLPSIPSVTLGVRFTLGVNDIPKFGDTSGALASRLLILPYRNSYVGREDRNLDRKLAAEIEGIFRFALEGLRRLRMNGRFTRPAISEAVLRDFERLSSPLQAFLQDCCGLEIDATVDRFELWQAWSAWCDRNGHQKGSRELLSARLRTVVPGFDSKRPRQDDGSRPRAYCGLRLKPEIDRTDG